MNGKEIVYSLHRSPKRRSIGIQVHLEKGLVVRAPTKVNLKKIEEFLQKKEDWISKKMFYRDDVNSKSESRDFLTNETIDVLGRPLIINYVPHNSKRLKLEFVSDKLHFYLPQEYNRELNRNKLKMKIISWYKEFAVKIIQSRLPIFTFQLDLYPKDVKIRFYKSRWGACRDDGIIIFNWRIIQAPIEIIDYVIVHELCHLKFMNHSKQYWNLVESVYPNYKESRKWLKENVLQLKFE
ncbi:MAG: M48 family metallopeptidase [Candidatus Heimdallarchaeota archaeon]|nr:M48 family metallopeptidase [Candidatus Heimdallarchaeota archaeon]